MWRLRPARTRARGGRSPFVDAPATAGGAGRVPAGALTDVSWRRGVRRWSGGPPVGRRVEEPLAAPSANEAVSPEPAALGRDRLLCSLPEAEERDGRRGTDRVERAELAVGWCGCGHGARHLCRGFGRTECPPVLGRPAPLGAAVPGRSGRGRRTVLRDTPLPRNAKALQAEGYAVASRIPQHGTAPRAWGANSTAPNKDHDRPEPTEPKASTTKRLRAHLDGDARSVLRAGLRLQIAGDGAIVRAPCLSRPHR